MLTKAALNKLTQAVVNRVTSEVYRYNDRLKSMFTEDDLYEHFSNKIDSRGELSFLPINTWNCLKEHYPNVFRELVDVIRSEHKTDKLDVYASYRLNEIIRPEVERLTVDLNEFDSDSLLVEQLFEKIYPMLVEAKYVYFESEKQEPVFDLSLPVEEVESEGVDFEFETPYASSGNENSQPEEESYDEGDWD